MMNEPLLIIAFFWQASGYSYWALYRICVNDWEGGSTYVERSDLFTWHHPQIDFYHSRWLILKFDLSFSHLRLESNPLAPPSVIVKYSWNSEKD